MSLLEKFALLGYYPEGSPVPVSLKQLPADTALYAVSEIKAVSPQKYSLKPQTTLSCSSLRAGMPADRCHCAPVWNNESPSTVLVVDRAMQDSANSVSTVSRRSALVIALKSPRLAACGVLST